MSILWLEGFELMGGSASMPAEMSKKYALALQNYSLATNAPGALGGYCVTFGKGSADDGEHCDRLTTPDFPEEDSIVVAFHVRRPNTGISGATMAIRGPDAWHVGLAIGSGTVRLFLANEADPDTPQTELCTWLIPQWTTDWHHVAVAVEFSETVGTAQLWWDGESMGSFADLQTSVDGTGATNVIFLTPSRQAIPQNSEGWSFDDIYVSTEYMGVLTVEGVRPSNGIIEDWTASTGTTEGAVDESPANDNDYVIGANDGDVITWEFPALTRTGDIAGVSTCLWAKQHGASGVTITPLTVDVDGVVADGTAEALTGSFDHFHTIWQEDPNTSATWDQYRRFVFGVRRDD